MVIMIQTKKYNLSLRQKNNIFGVLALIFAIGLYYALYGLVDYINNLKEGDIIKEPVFSIIVGTWCFVALCFSVYCIQKEES